MARQDPLTPFERQRQAWCKAGHSVLANEASDTHLIAWAQHPGRLCRIDRPGKWGNPYALSKGARPEERLLVVRKYARWFLEESGLGSDLEELVGQVLVCHCTPALCHGQILLDSLDPAFALAYRLYCDALLESSRAPGRACPLEFIPIKPLAARA